VSGITNITATAAASAPGTVSNVKYYLDGSATALGTGGAAPTYTFPWNTAFSNDGVHTIRATVTDSNSMATQSSVVTVTVNNSATPDTTPPTVALSNLVTGDFVTDQVTLKATATDNVGVASVTFRYRLNGAGPYINIGSPDTTSPYEVPWNATPLSAGSYEVTALAIDTAPVSNTSAISTPATVTLVVRTGYTVAVNDLFTGTQASNLNAHVADTGQIWERHPHASYATGNLLLYSNAVGADATTNRSLSMVNFTPQTNNYRVKGVLKTTATKDDSHAALAIQVDATANSFIYLEYSGDLDQLALGHMNNGVPVTVGSYPVNFTFSTANTSRDIIVDVVLPRLSVFVEGIRRIDAFNPMSTSTYRRIGLFGPGTPQAATAGFHWDSLTVSTVAATIPAAPTNIACARASNTTVLCNFEDNSSNEDAFVIEKSLDNTVWVSAGSNLAANATSFTVTTTTGLQQYYRVRASNAAGASANSPSPLTTTSGCYSYFPATCP